MTVSPAMRRYAAEIYRLQQYHDQVSLSLLSSHVESSARIRMDIWYMSRIAASASRRRVKESQCLPCAATA
jgi:hypothetical protein